MERVQPQAFLEHQNRKAVSTIDLRLFTIALPFFASSVRRSRRGLAKFEACHWARTRRVLCPLTLDFTGSVRFRVT